MIIKSNEIKKSEIVRIIQIFNSKTKLNIKEISDNLGYSRQTFYNKFERLKKEKIIGQFTININPNIRPNNLKYVLLEVKTNPQEPELVKNLKLIPQLRILDGILGDYSLFALFVFNSSRDYYNALNKIDEVMSKSYFKKYQIIDTIKVFKTNGIALDNKIVNNQYELDKIDYIILKILQKKQDLNPISTYEIKKEIKESFQKVLKELNKEDISQSTIHNRIKKLESSGVILNYTVNFNPKKIGFKGKYLVRIKPKDPSKYNEIALHLEKNSFITDLFRIGEQHGLFAIVRVKKVEEYAKFIKDLYQSNEIEDTFTSFVLDELKVYTNFVIH
jgi:DNA-binding Lrp family transcriptional regulator